MHCTNIVSIFLFHSRKTYSLLYDFFSQENERLYFLDGIEKEILWYSSRSVASTSFGRKEWKLELGIFNGLVRLNEVEQSLWVRDSTIPGKTSDSKPIRLDELEFE